MFCMSARVEWNHAAVAASARQILDGFRRDAFNQAKETCELCGRRIIPEKFLEQSRGDPSICGELRSCNPSAVSHLVNPTSEHHSLYDRLNLRFKLIVVHIARILHLTRSR